MSSSSRNSSHHRNVIASSSALPLVNGSSASKVMMMEAHQQLRASHRGTVDPRYHHQLSEDHPTVIYHNDPSSGMFHRSSSSRTKGSTLSTSSSASSSPSLSLARDGGRGSGAGGQKNGDLPTASSRGNLVKQMVDNLYTNSSAVPKSTPSNLLTNHYHQPNPSNPNTNTASSTSSSVRSSFRAPSSNGTPTPTTNPMSPSTAQRCFVANLKSQFTEPSLSSSSSGHPTLHNYDNLSPLPSSYALKEARNRGSIANSSVPHSDSPSLDRKSLTRASLPMGSSSHPYYYRSGSGMSTASSTTSGGLPGQVYGQINQAASSSSGRGVKAAYLDGDLLESHTNGTTPTTTTATWVEILEPKSRSKMFANLNTGECRWEEPKGVPILRANNPNITQWWELYDQKTHRFYYYSSRDFKTIWQKPTSPDAVVVPLAKLQILKQNTNHHLNESFDSGTGGGGGGGGNCSSGHVTPSSPSLSSPSHPFGSRLKAWATNGGPGGPFGPIASPVAPAMVDSCTQTQNPLTSKPTMVSRWTQTMNLTPTHSRVAVQSHQQQQQPVQSRQQRPPGMAKGPVNGGGKAQPSLHHYLLSEKRFAKGRYSMLPPGVPGGGGPPMESIYDPVYGSNSHGLVYGNAGDFYDIVASDPSVPNQMAIAQRNGPVGQDLYYEDVYEDDAEYYDSEDGEYLEDESEDSSCDADDEFAGEGEESLDSEDEDGEDEEDEECDFDETEEELEDLVDGRERLAAAQRRPPQPEVYQPNANDLELYSAEGDFGDFVRGHSHRQPLQVAIRASVKVSSTSGKSREQQLNEAAKGQQHQQSEGLRMSSSFSAVDFKRNALGRSSYTPALHHYQQQQQQLPTPNGQQPLNVSNGAPPSQSYSNPFNSGSLRSSTGRIGVQQAPVISGRSAAAAAPGSAASKISDRIQLFNQKSGTASGQQGGSGQLSPSPVIIHRTPSSPPGVIQQQTSTPLTTSSARHSSGATETTAGNANLQRYFNHSPSSVQPVPAVSSQPSKSHSLSQIAPTNANSQQPAATSPNGTVSKLSSNLASLTVGAGGKASGEASNASYYAIPPSSSSEGLSASLTPQIVKRNFAPGPKGNATSPNASYESGLEQTRSSGRSLANTFGHSLSVSGSGDSRGSNVSTLTNSPSGPLQISSSTSAINRNSGGANSSFLGSFNDSHLVMLNKSQSAMVGPGTGQQQGHPKKAKEHKDAKGKGTGAKGTKKTKENKVPKMNGSPTKKKTIVGGAKDGADISIEVFAKECVSRHRKGGIFSKKKTLKSMLTHTKKPLKKPMISTISDNLLVKESVNCFKMIQIFMRDRAPTPTGPEEEPSGPTFGGLTDEQLLVRLINVCVQLVPLRDEVLVQVARQVTQNPSPESEQRGLELMCVLFWYFTASNKLASHLHAFLAGHRNTFTSVVRRKFEQQLSRARHTHSHLFFRKPHSPEEVGRVLRCVRARHAGLFGETLGDGIVGGETDPKKQLPWPIVLLTEALLEPRHEDREGVFRCVGDMDDVHKLKMKIDTILPSDPYFSELIGRSKSNAGVGKLSDPHDLHVIASTLKLYFRELREAVIPAELYLEALDCAHSPARACSLLDRLPPANRATLCYLIRFLQVFSSPDQVRDTKMDDANLSMVWAPNILRSLNPSMNLPGPGPNGALLALASANSANIYEQTRAEMSLVRTLIQHLDTNNAMVQ